MCMEIEQLHEMLSTASKDLITLTFEHRTLQKKMTDYVEMNEKYIQE